MRTLSTFVFTTLIAASIAACSSSPTAPTNPTVVTMAPGQSTQVGALSLKFIGVTIDTRCPANALCIQVGDAFVALETTASSNCRFSIRQNAARRTVDIPSSCRRSARIRSASRSSPRTIASTFESRENSNSRVEAGSLDPADRLLYCSTLRALNTGYTTGRS